MKCAKCGSEQVVKNGIHLGKYHIHLSKLIQTKKETNNIERNNQRH